MSFDVYRVVDFSPVKGLGFVGQREDKDTARVSLELDYNQLVFTLDTFDGSRDKMYEAIGKFLGLLMQMGMIATVEEEERDIVIIKYEHNDALAMNEGMGVDQPIWCTFEEIEWLEACRDGKCEKMAAKVNCRYEEEDDDCFCEYCSDSCDFYEDCHNEPEQPEDVSWEKSKKPAELHYNWDCWDCDHCYHKFSCERSDHLEATPKYKTQPANRSARNVTDWNSRPDPEEVD